MRILLLAGVPTSFRQALSHTAEWQQQQEQSPTMLLLLLHQQGLGSLPSPLPQQYSVSFENWFLLFAHAHFACRRPHLVPTGTFTHRRVTAAAAAAAEKPNHAAAAAPAGPGQPAPHQMDLTQAQGSAAAVMGGSARLSPAGNAVCLLRFFSANRTFYVM
jgi:hypothetical protein